MGRLALHVALVVLLAFLAFRSLDWGISHARIDSADLLRRAEEIELFTRGADPYDDPDMTYPPTALAVLAPLVAPFGTWGTSSLKGFWIGLNLTALAALCWAAVRLWGEGWPTWLKMAFALAVIASKPVRGGIGLGQFHLVPTAFMLLAVLALRARRPLVAGLLIGVALAKPTMVLPFLGYLVARKQWSALGAAIVFQAVALAGVSAWLRMGPLRLVSRWLANARSQEGAGLIDLPTLAQKACSWPISGTAIALLLLAVTFAATMALRDRSEVGLVSFCAYMSAIFTYHRPYDLVLLTPTLAYLIEAAQRATTEAGSRFQGLAAASFALLLLVPKEPLVGSRYEGAYDPAFIVLSYGFLALVVFNLISERPREEAAAEARRA